MARADFFLWEDAKTGLSMSFPDTWQLGSAIQPSTILALKAPAPASHYTTCKIRVEDETRYKSYAPINNGAVQKFLYGAQYWEKRVATFYDPAVLSISENAALGRSEASFVVADYKKKIGWRQFVDMRGMMFASLYYDKVYFFECETRRDQFRRWKNMFLSIAKSIDYPKIHHELPNGNFRYFSDEGIVMNDPMGIGTTLY